MVTPDGAEHRKLEACFCPPAGQTIWRAYETESHVHDRVLFPWIGSCSERDRRRAKGRRSLPAAHPRKAGHRHRDSRSHRRLFGKAPTTPMVSSARKTAESYLRKSSPAPLAGSIQRTNSPSLPRTLTAPELSASTTRAASSALSAPARIRAAIPTSAMSRRS